MLVEVAFIKLTKPAMEANLDSILQRLAELEEQMASGVTAVPSVSAGYNQTGGMPVRTIPGQPELPSGSQNHGVNPESSVSAYIPPETVSLPSAQVEDLNLIRNEWGKIVREMGMSIRPSFRDTVVEPSGDSCLCIVFSNAANYAIGSRPSVLGDLERHIEEAYGKKLYLKSRLAGAGERFDTIYVSEEDLRKNIHMDITIED